MSKTTVREYDKDGKVVREIVIERDPVVITPHPSPVPLPQPIRGRCPNVGPNGYGACNCTGACMRPSGVDPRPYTSASGTWRQP